MNKNKIKILIIAGIIGVFSVGIIFSAIGALNTKTKETKAKTEQELVSKPTPKQDANGVKTAPNKANNKENLNVYEELYCNCFPKIEMPQLVNYPKDNLNYIFFLNLQAIQEEILSSMGELSDGSSSITDYRALLRTVKLNIETCNDALKKLEELNKSVNKSDETASYILEQYNKFYSLLSEEEPLIAKMEKDTTITEDLFAQTYSSKIKNFESNLTNLKTELNLAQTDNNKINLFKNQVRDQLNNDTKYNK